MDEAIDLKDFSPANKYKQAVGREIERVFIDKSPPQGFGESVRTLFKEGVGKRDRLGAALQVINLMLPQPAKDAIRSKLDYTQDKMPFLPDDYELEGNRSGGMNDVFLLESKNNEVSYVLKVLKDEVGESNTNKLVAIATEQKRDYDNVSEKFAHMQDFVPPEYFIIAHGPRSGEPSVVAIQPFIGGRIRDIFSDINKEELVDLLSKNGALKNQLREFVKVIKENKFLIDNELDLIGQNNLAVVGEGGNEKLLLLDAHSRTPQARAKHFREEIDRRVNYLSSLTE
jgi:hypothetical protein